MRTNESHLEPKHELTAESKPELGKPTTEMPEHREHAEQKPEHSLENQEHGQEHTEHAELKPKHEHSDHGEDAVQEPEHDHAEVKPNPGEVGPEHESGPEENPRLEPIVIPGFPGCVLDNNTETDP